MRQYNGNLTRITKTTAKKLYNAGHDVLFIPCNLHPENNFYSLGIWENVNLCGQYDSFETLCNYFAAYNCNSETGKYIAFYIKKGVAA